MWYRLGQALAGQGPSKLPEALEAFTKAAALTPSDTGEAPMHEGAQPGHLLLSSQ